MARESIEFSINLSEFAKAIREAPEVAAEAAKRGMHDALDDWKRKAVDVAPLSKGGGTLRRSIHTEPIKGEGLALTGEISASAIEVASKGKWAGKRFNYAYYLHEIFPNKHGHSFKHPSTPGTVPDFLDQPAARNGEKWIRDIEKEIIDELKRKGW